MEKITYSLTTLPTVVEHLITLMPDCAVFTFVGPLGAGKTTLIKQLLARCGVKEVVMSPTFTYVATYTNDRGQTFYHFDLYRFKTLHDFMQAGFDEYLYVPDSWAFIEWPEILKPILTHNVCAVTIDYVSEDLRMITIDKK